MGSDRGSRLECQHYVFLRLAALPERASPASPSGTPHAHLSYFSQTPHSANLVSLPVLRSPSHPPVGKPSGAGLRGSPLEVAVDLSQPCPRRHTHITTSPLSFRSTDGSMCLSQGQPPSHKASMYTTARPRPALSPLATLDFPPPWCGILALPGGPRHHLYSPSGQLDTLLTISASAAAAATVFDTAVQYRRKQESISCLMCSSFYFVASYLLSAPPVRKSVIESGVCPVSVRCLSGIRPYPFPTNYPSRRFPVFNISSLSLHSSTYHTLPIIPIKDTVSPDGKEGLSLGGRAVQNSERRFRTFDVFHEVLRRP
ncbi:hypothetical protein B0H63DRAFT_309485 [Podospora didyma]|uniref:Uncharacterized protein n=1 Tax=Podospora didyma TaxID=330526 RepID=A0AAE0K4Y2_9PEZI|nr:hypothetical protein B0H63DRAFT_309485 [Podospora didyma]